jgi:hypothetical protein
VYGFYNADAATGIAGRGFVVGSPPANTHWTPESRELLYPVFERWFGIPDPKKEYSKRRPPEDLLCLTPEATKAFRVEPLHQIAARLAEERGTKARSEQARLDADQRRERLRRDWARLLGDITPKTDPVVRERRQDEQRLVGVTVERLHLSPEPGIVIPALLLLPPRGDKTRLPIVVAIAQGGKQEFLKHRRDTIAALLESGVAVCLPDLRGTGESSPPGGRDRGSPVSSLSASYLMLGQPLVGARLRDLRSILKYVRQRPDMDGTRIALWGDSFASPNPADADVRVPHGIEGRPTAAEPLGGLLTLLGALFEDDVRAVYVRGGLSGYQSVLHSPFCYLPHDTVIPGVLATGDLSDVAVALAPRPLRLEGLVDGLNRPLSAETLRETYAPVRDTYRDNRFVLENKPSSGRDVARWLQQHLRGK